MMTVFLVTNQAEHDALNRVFDDALFSTVLFRTTAVWAIVLNAVDRGVGWTARAGSRAVSAAARENEHPALTEFMRSIENGVAVNT